MAHQINLLDVQRLTRREWLTAVTVLWVVGGLLALSGVGTLSLRVLQTRVEQKAKQEELALASMRSQTPSTQPGAVSQQTTELAQLRAQDAAQRRVLSVLQSGSAGTPQGYSGYLLALSRQTPGNLWLTRFEVAADGRGVEIGGRMTDPRELPAYLRRLNAEPLFRGREFAQLDLKAGEVAAGPTSAASTPYAEFALRSAASASEPR